MTEHLQHLVHKRFPFPKGCNCSEIVMRETTGIDEQQAAMMADAHGDRTNLYQELIRASIVSVDGKEVDQPFTPLSTWNSRTRALVIKAYESLNDLADKEVKDFIAASKDVTPGLAAVQEEAKSKGAKSA